MEFPRWRQVLPDTPRRPYVPSAACRFQGLMPDPVKGLHFGQRKLLLSEIEFLTACENGKLTESSPSSSVGTAAMIHLPLLVVYAGAANGSHLPTLFSLFPSVKFVLVDPAPFCAAVQEISARDGSPILELIDGCCTNELCLRLRRVYSTSYTIVLISDIRSGAPSRSTNREHTDMILRDNAAQHSWACQLDALATMLKFHPPYPRVLDPASPKFDPADTTPETIDYLDGHTLLGVWAPKSSSEIRLVVEGPFNAAAGATTTAATTGARTNRSAARMRTYDCRAFEEQLYYLNTSNRYALDCRAERHILTSFLRSSRRVREEGDTQTVEELSQHISTALGYPRFTPLSPDFTEEDARLAALLYLPRNHQRWVPLFDELRGKLTTRGVVDLLCRRLGIHSSGNSASPSQSAATNGEADKVLELTMLLPSGFWNEVATPKHLEEAFSVPPPPAPPRPVVQLDAADAPPQQESDRRERSSAMRHPFGSHRGRGGGPRGRGGRGSWGGDRGGGAGGKRLRDDRDA